MDFGSEIKYKTSRSTGPGGQNVNKVNTKVELRFDVVNSDLLSCEEKELLHRKLKNKITIDGILIIVSQQSRSQLKNKKIAAEKFYQLIQNALTPDAKRIPIHLPASQRIKRLEQKRKHAEKKDFRKPPEI